MNFLLLLNHNVEYVLTLSLEMLHHNLEEKFYNYELLETYDKNSKKQEYLN